MHAEVLGAGGSDGAGFKSLIGGAGGPGGRVTGTIDGLGADDVLTITVGGADGTGGGLSAVWNGTPFTADAALLIAGGGGGGTSISFPPER